MAIQTEYLDPNAASYTDDEIVGKVNSATANITRTDAVEDGALKESASFKKISDTEKTKLGGIDEGAEVNPADLAALDSAQDTKLNGIEENAAVNPTDDEVVGQINTASVAITREDALSQDDLNIVKTAPTTGQFKVKNIHRHTDGTYAHDYDDVAES